MTTFVLLVCFGNINYCIPQKIREYEGFWNCNKAALEFTAKMQQGAAYCEPKGVRLTGPKEVE